LLKPYSDRNSLQMLSDIEVYYSFSISDCITIDVSLYGRIRGSSDACLG